jgi:hypothetical protein
MATELPDIQKRKTMAGAAPQGHEATPLAKSLLLPTVLVLVTLGTAAYLSSVAYSQIHLKFVTVGFFWLPMLFSGFFFIWLAHLALSLFLSLWFNLKVLCV